MNIPSSIITLILGIVLTLVSLWYGQNNGLMPIAASEEAEAIDGIFNVMLTIGTGLFLLVQGILIYCLLFFRRKKGDNTDGPPIEGNVPLEILWTAIPAVIVFTLSIYSFEVYNTMGGLDPHAAHDIGLHAHHVAPTTDKNLLAANLDSDKLAYGLGISAETEDQTTFKVKVNAMQYAWIFTYPDSGIVSGELHVPINKAIELDMEATDVIHAFWLPEFRIKQDVIPGRVTELVFSANKAGQYPVVCAELCGSYHGGMKTVLYVHSPEDYEQWVQSNTVASTEPTKNLAAATSEGEFLAHHVQALGLVPDVTQLQQLHIHH